jgi:hypothetical protein
MIEAKKILAPTWISDYEKEIGAIWFQVVELNSNLFLLEHISKFPFNLFLVPPQTFWTLTRNALYESCVMCAWRIAVDADGNCLTAAQLKNAVLKNTVDATAKRSLQAELKAVEFEKTLKAIKPKIRDLRHKLYAHFNRPETEPTAAPGAAVPRVSLTDLKTVRDRLNALLQVLALDTELLFLPLDYDPKIQHPANTDSRPDIVRLLDMIAENSPIIRDPESNPELWEHHRKLMDEDKLNAINLYRHKLGLPKV